MSATPAASARQVLEQADVRVEMGADAALEEGVSLRAQPLKLALVRLVVAIGLLVAWQLVAGRLVDKFWISLIQFSAGQFDTAGVFAALFVLMVLATLLNEGLDRAERHVLRWKTAGRA